MSSPCPKCGRLYTWDGSRCCNKYCRHGSTKKPKIDFRKVRHQKFLAEGGRPATAAWIPYWYELDPPCLEIRLTAEFTFWRQIPDQLSGPEPLVLYCGLGGEEVDVAWGTIADIWHPDFGSILSLNMRGLDYKITTADGKELAINAEENPGKLYERRADEWSESELIVRSWRFTIEFAALAEREPLQTHGDLD
jgi:hypothetical protein